MMSVTTTTVTCQQLPHPVNESSSVRLYTWLLGLQISLIKLTLPDIKCDRFINSSKFNIYATHNVLPNKIPV